ncbi:hypothetical protein D3C75_1166160 [compost metagenome]
MLAQQIGGGAVGQAVGAFGLDHRRDACQVTLEEADVGVVGALVAEQELGLGPAAVLFADQVFDWYAHAVEEHLVDGMVAVDGLDRAHGHPGGVHRHDQHG